MPVKSDGKAYEHVIREVLGVQPGSAMDKMLIRSDIDNVDRLLTLKEDFLKEVTVTGSDGNQHYLPRFQWTNILNLGRYREHQQQQGTPIRDWLKVTAKELTIYVEDYGPYNITETDPTPPKKGNQIHPKYEPAAYHSTHGRPTFKGSIYDNLETSPMDLRMKLFAQGIHPYKPKSTQSSVASTPTKIACEDIAPDEGNGKQSSKRVEERIDATNDGGKRQRPSTHSPKHNTKNPSEQPRYQHGFEIPRNMQHALELDAKNGNSLWRTAIDRELANHSIYDMATNAERGIIPHWSFKIHSDGRHKARHIIDEAADKEHVPTHDTESEPPLTAHEDDDDTPPPLLTRSIEDSFDSDDDDDEDDVEDIEVDHHGTEISPSPSSYASPPYTPIKPMPCQSPSPLSWTSTRSTRAYASVSEAEADAERLRQHEFKILQSIMAGMPGLCDSPNAADHCSTTDEDLTIDGDTDYTAPKDAAIDPPVPTSSSASSHGEHAPTKAPVDVTPHMKSIDVRPHQHVASTPTKTYAEAIVTPPTKHRMTSSPTLTTLHSPSSLVPRSPPSVSSSDGERSHQKADSRSGTGSDKASLASKSTGSDGSKETLADDDPYITVSRKHKKRNKKPDMTDTMNATPDAKVDETSNKANSHNTMVVTPEQASDSHLKSKTIFIPSQDAEQLRSDYQDIFEETLSFIDITPRGRKTDTSIPCNNEQADKFRKIMGRLQYVASMGAIDIQSHVKLLQPHCGNPMRQHFNHAKLLTRYVITFPRSVEWKIEGPYLPVHNQAERHVMKQNYAVKHATESDRTTGELQQQN